MTQLVWNQIGDRRYETGVDRGVLYLPDDTGVAWNGLTAVDEDGSATTSTAYYFDGVKYLEKRKTGTYSGTLQALTYPDEFLPFDGYQTVHEGLLASDQPVRDYFGLSYRTLVGNDLEGQDYGYKLHLLYNLVATPETKTFNTVSSSIGITPFSWKISGVPIPVPGFRPTNHFVLDSSRMHPGFLEILEEILYGTDDTSPTMPTPEELIAILQDSISEPLSEPL